MDNRVLVSWSGGKDSCLACFKAMQQGYTVHSLLHFYSRGTGKGCFHGLDSALLKHQAECIGLPLSDWPVGPDMRTYEEEFKAAVNSFKPAGIGAMVFGDIYLDDHESWVERVCGELQVKALEPLWKLDPLQIMQEFFSLGFKTMIVSCKADIMGREYLGKIMDMNMVRELQGRGICPCGERGEFHTLVVDGPIFRKPISIIESEPLLRESFWTHWALDIRKFS
jgi:diphthine-ammonia ligase